MPENVKNVQSRSFVKCSVQIRAAASGLELTEEQFVELQSLHWARFYSICVQYQQVTVSLGAFLPVIFQ